MDNKMLHKQSLTYYLDEFRYKNMQLSVDICFLPVM